jgi:hypothetical protein
MHRHARSGAALVALVAGLCWPGPAALVSGAPGVAEPTFESHWQDGRAELAGYVYHVTRYGEPRTGQAVMITVTEPFSESKRVKVDSPAKNPGDTFEALKMNIVRDFQTGIYDYNTMTSVFVRSRDFSPVKISFSSAEWCGHVYEELLFDGRTVRQSLRSYFEGESGDHSIPWPGNAVSEDQLFILVRGLRGEYLAPGASRSLSLLPGSLWRRLAHRPLAAVAATIERAAKPERVTVSAGVFLTDYYEVRIGGSRKGSIWVERAAPHRIVRWAWMSMAERDQRGGEAAEAAELTGSSRLPYWKLLANGQESYLKSLGLQPQPSPGRGARR